MTAFGGILAGDCGLEFISIPFVESSIDIVEISLFVLDKYFNDSITFRAPKLSSPVVGSSLKNKETF